MSPGTGRSHPRSHLRIQHVQRARGGESLPRIVPVFTGLGIIHLRGPYDYPRHQHQAYEVILVDMGHYRCKLNDVALSLERDGILVVKPGDWHEDFCEPPLRYFGVNFYLDPQWQGPESLGLFCDAVTPEQQRFQSDRSLFWALVKDIQDEAAAADALAPQIQDALLLEFFWRLVRALPREAISSAFLDASFDHAFPAQVRRLFQTHLATQLSVAEMAEKLNMSESSLAHKCTAILGESPARAFLRCKLERACVLLAHTAMPVKEIAFRLGFEDPYHFSRAFRKFFGKPPSACR